MSSKPLLEINDLTVSIAEKEILHALSLTVLPGEIHAIMGPNGSGKSTLVNTLMGHPAYDITKGSVSFEEENLLKLDTTERAKKGLFLAFQYPKEIAGVTLRSMLFSAARSQRMARDPNLKAFSPVKFQKEVTAAMQELGMDPAFAERALNRGFSGGEKKKAEVLQMTILQPKLALLDETDSGLDIDALKIVAAGVNRLRSPGFSAVVVTHYARLLQYIVPDRVHVMVRGEIVESGGKELAERLEKEGYAKWGIKE
jgi:Fe-S cluster assembly ATP-binding protein